MAIGRRFLAYYSELAQESLAARDWQHDGFLVWRLYPKMHLLLHILEDQVATVGNPRDRWCYCDESEIGAATNVAESSHPSTVHRRVMEKYHLQ